MKNVSILKSLSNNPTASLLINLVSALAAIGSLLVAFYVVQTEYEYNLLVQDRAGQLENVRKFDQTTSLMISAGADFLRALNASADLAATRARITDLATTQSIEADNLRREFRVDVELAAYERAVYNFTRTSQITSSPENIKNWVENFGAVVDSRDKLIKTLQKATIRHSG